MDTSQTAQAFMLRVDDAEKILRWNTAKPGTAALTEVVGKVRPTEREEHTSEMVSSMAQDLAAAKVARGE